MFFHEITCLSCMQIFLFFILQRYLFPHLLLLAASGGICVTGKLVCFLWLRLLPSTCPAPPVRSAVPTGLSVWRGDSVLPESTSILSSEGRPTWCSMAASSTALLTLPHRGAGSAPGGNVKWKDMLIQPRASSSPSIRSWCPDQRSPHIRPSPNS